MLNPYVLLGLLLFWAASVTGAYLKGHAVAEDHARAAYAGQLETAIADFNVQAAADQKRAAEAAAKEATARTRAAMTRSAANEAIRSKPLPAVCDWEPKSYGLLVAAVKEANGTDAADGNRLPDAVRRANRTGKPER